MTAAADVGAVIVAAALDAVLGEPPARVHPVVWAGHYLEAAARFVPAEPPAAAALSGAGAWLLGAGATALGWGLLERLAHHIPGVGRPAIAGAALWPLTSGRLLLHEVAAVERALSVDVIAGRTAVARIVSRDTTSLGPHEVRAAALESLAENLSDSVVAPLFWYLVGGLPAAAVYRFANTADAMWGYRSPRWEYAGRVAARVDDLLSLIPARLTAALVLAGAGRSSWRGLVRQARRTPSPNAGWPMAALALRLDRRLGKNGAYLLNESATDPLPADTERALAVARHTIAASVGLAAAGALLKPRLIRQPTGGSS